MRWVYSQQQAELVRIGTRSNGWLDCLLVFHHQPMTHDLPDSRWIIKLPQMCFQHSRRTEHYQTHAHFFFGAKPITYYSNNDNCPVIDHGNWGKISRLKRNLLLNANCWSKQQHTVITSSQPLNEWWLKDPTSRIYVTTCYDGQLLRGIILRHLLTCTILVRISVCTYKNLDSISERSNCQWSCERIIERL